MRAENLKSQSRSRTLDTAVKYNKKCFYKYQQQEGWESPAFAEYGEYHGDKEWEKRWGT